MLFLEPLHKADRLQLLIYLHVLIMMSMAFVVTLRTFVVIFFTFQYLCNSQKIVGDGTVCNGKCYENVRCIASYDELELYVKSNRQLLESFKHTFFATAKTPAEFVRILYNFKLPVSSDSTQNADVKNCSDHQISMHIWSEKFLYLLGPRALKFLTFFAISVREDDITIDLPCICHDQYDLLLSRLTDMVCLSKLCVKFDIK